MSSTGLPVCLSRTIPAIERPRLEPKLETRAVRDPPMFIGIFVGLGIRCLPGHCRNARVLDRRTLEIQDGHAFAAQALEPEPALLVGDGVARQARHERGPVKFLTISMEDIAGPREIQIVVELAQIGDEEISDSDAHAGERLALPVQQPAVDRHIAHEVKGPFGGLGFPGRVDPGRSEPIGHRQQHARTADRQAVERRIGHVGRGELEPARGVGDGAELREWPVRYGPSVDEVQASPGQVRPSGPRTRPA